MATVQRMQVGASHDNLSIVPLNVGNFTHAEKSTMTLLAGQGVKVRSPNIIWYIDGAKEKIVVDTGPSDPEWSALYHHPLERNESQRPDNALRAIGVDPESIGIVICTHLHWDHCHGLACFPNARVLVQRSELQYAVAPLPPHRISYDLHTGAPPFLAPAVISRFECVAGDLEVVPGVTVLHTPGHTPGMQGVAVATRAGTYVIAGDTVALFECWENDPPIPGAIYVDLEAYYRTFHRIREIADFVLPGHDMKVLDRQRYP